jgi:predicted RNase H-like HicB family nuclease
MLRLEVCHECTNYKIIRASTQADKFHGNKLIFPLLYWFEYLCENLYAMERIINIQIEKLPEGYYLATSDSIQGLVAQGRTITETFEIARDVVKKLIESQ